MYLLIPHWIGESVRFLAMGSLSHDTEAPRNQSYTSQVCDVVAAAVESTDGWSDGFPQGIVGSSGAVLHSMCTSSYPIGSESLLDFLPWDF